MLADVTASDKMECSRTTYDDYVSALEKLFVIQDIDAWCPAIRRKRPFKAARNGVSVTRRLLSP